MTGFSSENRKLAIENWLLAVGASTEDVESALATLRHSALVLFPLSLLLVAAISGVFANRSLRPVAELTEQASMRIQQLSRSTPERETPRASSRGEDELQVLATTFNRLFQQLDSLTETPFGRYLNHLENNFEQARKSAQLGPDIWEMSCPTARNLSLPREDLQRIGLFDEQFRNSCEDHDLAHRAGEIGRRFLYNNAITCVHNDQAGELKRYCHAQRRGAQDTVFFCAKYPAIHGGAAIARVNGYVSFSDGPALIIKKIAKKMLATRPIVALIEKTILLAERFGMPDSALWNLYRVLIGLYIFRGWREGLKTLKRSSTWSNAHGIGCHSNV